VETESTVLNTIGIAGADWRVLSTTCSKISNSIAKIGVEARTLHREIRAQGREADQAFVVKYNSQRDNVLAAALLQIRSRMSPQGWGALQRYLANTQQNSKTVRLQ
jgi:hypothetical protein